MTSDWETMRGIRKGDKPNPAKTLYKMYAKWCEKHGIEASEERAWLQYMVEFRGYSYEKHKEKACLMLNKWIAPKSTMHKIRQKPRLRCKHCGSLYQLKPIPRPVIRKKRGKKLEIGDET